MFAFQNFTYAPGTVLAVFEDGCVEKNIGFADCVGCGSTKISELTMADIQVNPVFLSCNVIATADLHWEGERFRLIEASNYVPQTEGE